MASTPLVLTIIYNRLKQSSLSTILSQDHETYLSELNTINRNRNISILKEIKAISVLLKKHQINHVDVKGTVLLTGGYYSVFCERLIRAIDLFITKDQKQKAFKLLIKELDYITQPVFPGICRTRAQKSICSQIILFVVVPCMVRANLNWFNTILVSQLALHFIYLIPKIKPFKSHLFFIYLLLAIKKSKL